jgi:rfaE bifunctional protein nucleotidyltransferase chain/domain
MQGLFSKILSIEQTDAWVASEKAAGHRIGFTCGSFDLLHAGHVQYLAAARELCDRLMVAVNSDASVRRYKGPSRPINPEDQRMYVVAGLASVDVVTRLDDDRPLALLERWKPHLYLKGGDYKEESLRSGDAVRSWGGEVHVIEPEFAVHTTAMLAARKPSQGLVLLDRDGTLIRNVPFLHDAAKVEILPGVIDALRKLQEAGYTLAIVTNQQGIGLGYFTLDDFIAVNQRLLRELGPHGIHIARIYFCPHSMSDDCECRKPAPGMILRAMREFGVGPEQTFVVGDQDSDLAAGESAGVRTWRTLERAAAALVPLG